MNARWMRHLFNLYPPYVGAGVRVAHISDDWRHVRVEMPLRWYNRNYVGTHFGGSLFAMTDPFLMIMAIRNLGPDYLVWDKAAQIEFVAPGRGTMIAEFRLDEADLGAMRARTADGSQYLPWFEVDVRAPDGSIVARVRKQLYVRRAKPPSEQAAAGGPRRT
jgi:acyl-coenzyme A thioesterase PaaI-like protein